MGSVGSENETDCRHLMIWIHCPVVAQPEFYKCEWSAILRIATWCQFRETVI